MAAKELAILVTAKDLASATLGKVNKELAGMGRASKAANSGLGALSAAGRRVGGAFGNLRGRVSGLAGSLGPLLGIGGVVGLTAAFTDSISKAEEFAATTAKLSRVIGMNAGDTSQLVDVMDKFGISGEAQITLFSRLEKNALTYSKAQDKTTASTAKAQKVLHSSTATVKQRAKATADLAKIQDQYGFSVKTSGGKIADANELLARSRDFFNSTATASQKATVLQKLYGKSWKDLIPLLSLSKAKFDEEFHSALRLTPQQLKDAAALRGAQREFNDTLGDTQTLIGLTILPSLTKLSRVAKSFLQNNQDRIIGAVKGAIGVAGQIGDAFIGVAKGLSSAWSAIPAPMRDLLIKGFVAEKTFKFLFGFSPAKLIIDTAGTAITKGIGGLLGGLFNRGGSPAAPMFTKEVGTVPGGTGVAGGGGKLGTALGALAIVGEAAAVFLTWQNTNQASTKQANDLAKQQNDWLKRGPSKDDIVKGLAAVDQGIASIRSNPLLTLVQGEALSKLESMDAQLRQQLNQMAANTSTGKAIVSAVSNLGPKIGSAFNSGGIIGAVLALIPHIDNINLRVNGGGVSRTGASQRSHAGRPTSGPPGSNLPGYSPPTRHGGGRARGGLVKAGVAYLVGEEGPELLVPKAHGTVIPHAKGKPAKGTGLPVYVTNWPAGGGGGIGDGLSTSEKLHVRRLNRDSALHDRLLHPRTHTIPPVVVVNVTHSARDTHRALKRYKRVGNGAAVGID